MTEPSRAVFLSYASQDTEAARRICEALRAANIEVWFDQSELRGGDAWDHKIRQQVHDCALFIPIISASTASRHEGYFRLEWDLADQRSHMIAHIKAFIVPVCLDATVDKGAVVPDSFLKVQWTRLPGGATPAAFCERIAVLLGGAEALGQPQFGARPTPSVLPTRASHGWKVLAVAGVLVALVGGWQAWRLMTPKPSGAAMQSSARAAIAVLPFVDMSEKKDQEYFSDGLSEELIDLLAKIPTLRVPARTSSFYFKGKPDDIATIAARLHVAHVLEGSFRMAGDRLRVTAQLIRADDGYHVWSETYDRKWDDVFKVQDEIAAAVVKALAVSLLGKAFPQTVKASNSEAYALYLQARSAYRVSNSLDEVKRSIELLEQAARLDPGFASTWALLSRARVGMYFLYKIGSYQKIRDEAYRDAHQAIIIDPTNAEGHIAMGRVHMFFDWNWGDAEYEIQRAFELDNSSGDVLQHKAYLSQAMGRMEEALRWARSATERDPLFYYNFELLAQVQFFSGKLAKAAATYQKELALFPEAGGVHAQIASVRLAQGRSDAA